LKAFRDADDVTITLEMRLRCRLVASAGTMRHNLSYSCCCSRRIDALRYLRHTRRPATARRPPTGAGPVIDRARPGWSPTSVGWSPTALTVVDPKLDSDRTGRTPITRRRTYGTGRPDLWRNICNIEHQYQHHQPFKCTDNNAISNNTKLVHWPLMSGLLVTFGTARRDLGGLGIYCCGPLLCSFKG